MKKKSVIVKAVAALLVMTSVVSVPCERVHAITDENREAHVALKKVLKERKKELFGDFCGDQKMPYAFKDIDNDKIDELIISPGFGFYSQGVFDYNDKKTKEVASVGQGEFTRFYTTNKVIYIHNSGHMGVLCDYYYKQNEKTKKYSLIAYAEKEYDEKDIDYTKPKKITYYKRGKKITKEQYTACVKTLKKDSKSISGARIKWSEY